PVPKLWCTQANGAIIHHVPIALYSDDTSRNQSKKWNKHMSYYFQLVDLHPK
ncbi:hypothetical protein CROQUDRAFT_13953, partial [Cronartium quercuum f. sp. fusiforme G11]